MEGAERNITHTNVEVKSLRNLQRSKKKISKLEFFYELSGIRILIKRSAVSIYLIF